MGERGEVAFVPMLPLSTSAAADDDDTVAVADITAPEVTATVPAAA